MENTFDKILIKDGENGFAVEGGTEKLVEAIKKLIKLTAARFANMRKLISAKNEWSMSMKNSTTNYVPVKKFSDF